MDREFEGRDEEPVQLNASTSNVVVVDNVRRRLQRTEGSGVHCAALRRVQCMARATAQWTHCGTVLIGLGRMRTAASAAVLLLLVANFTGS